MGKTWAAWRNPAAAGAPWSRWHRLGAGGRTVCGLPLPPPGFEQAIRDVAPTALTACRKCERAAGGLAGPHRRRGGHPSHTPGRGRLAAQKARGEP